MIAEEGFVRIVELDGQRWRVKWNPTGQLSGAGRGLERKITISCSPENGPVQHIEIWTNEIADVGAFMSLDDEQIKNLIRRSYTRTWTDPTGRTWKVSIEPPSGRALAVPQDWPKGKPTESPHALYIRFTDPANPACHPSVPYTSSKSLSQLTDEEIAGYWEQVLATNPELRGT